MKPEQENFDQLCRLLKLKRYEQPPPRYFNDFSSRVIARVSGEAALDGGSWLIRLWSLIEAKPMLPGAVGVAICALLVIGAISTDSPTNPLEPIVADTDPARFAPEPFVAVNQGEAHAVAFTSTNPVIQLGGGSLFDQIRLSRPPALVSRPGGND